MLMISGKCIVGGDARTKAWLAWKWEVLYERNYHQLCCLPWKIVCKWRHFISHWISEYFPTLHFKSGILYLYNYNFFPICITSSWLESTVWVTSDVSECSKLVRRLCWFALETGLKVIIFLAWPLKERRGTSVFVKLLTSLSVKSIPFNVVTI